MSDAPKGVARADVRDGEFYWCSWLRWDDKRPRFPERMAAQVRMSDGHSDVTFDNWAGFGERGFVVFLTEEEAMSVYRRALTQWVAARERVSRAILAEAGCDMEPLTAAVQRLEAERAALVAENAALTADLRSAVADNETFKMDARRARQAWERAEAQLGEIRAAQRAAELRRQGRGG